MKDEKGSGSTEGKRTEKEAYLKQVMEIVNASPVYRYLGIEVVHTEKGSSRLELMVREDLKNVWGTLHGGILATLLDSACGVALGTLLEPGEVMVTLDLHINYLAPFHNGTLIAEGKAVHKGRNTGLAEATIKDAGGRIIAKGMTTHFCKRDSNKELDI